MQEEYKQSAIVLGLPVTYDELVTGDTELQTSVGIDIREFLMQFLLKEIAVFHRDITKKDMLLMTDEELGKGVITEESSTEDDVLMSYRWEKMPVLLMHGPRLTSPKRIVLVCTKLYIPKHVPIH